MAGGVGVVFDGVGAVVGGGLVNEFVLRRIALPFPLVRGGGCDGTPFFLFQEIKKKEGKINIYKRRSMNKNKCNCIIYGEEEEESL